jgi:plasmid maintenance system antidote protein VapI
MKKRISEVYPVSVFIKEEMESRGWTEKELVKYSWLRPAKIKHILDDGIITKTMATGLGRAFGTSMEYWMNLQKLWYLGLVIAIEDEEMELRKLNNLGGHKNAK